MFRLLPRSTLFPYTTLFRSLKVVEITSVFVQHHRVWGQQRELLHVQLLQSLVERLRDRKSTRLNSSHSQISYAVFCLKKISEYTAPWCNAEDCQRAEEIAER